MRTRQGETICLGEWIRPASADFPPAERGLGNECGRDSVSDFLMADFVSKKEFICLLAKCVFNIL